MTALSDNAASMLPPRRPGVPVWACILIALTLSLFSCVAGIGVGFFAWATAHKSGAFDRPDPALEGISLEAQVIAGADDAPWILEVTATNSLDRPRSLDAIEIYHTLARPEEIIASSPQWDRGFVYDEGPPENAYSALVFDGVEIPAGASLVVRFSLRPEASTGIRAGAVDLYANGSEGWLRTEASYRPPRPVSDPGPTRGDDPGG